MTRILVVDDSPMDRRLAGGILAKNGFTVDYAGDGRAALEAMAVELPSAVVTDLQMPEMDGLALVAECRRLHPSIPIVLMTAHGSADTAVLALKTGAASYVPKRSLASDLVNTLRDILALTREVDRSSTVDPLEVRTVNLEIRSSLEAIAEVVGQLESHLIQLALCDETGMLQVGVALREALVNAVVHGNLEVSSKLHEESPTRFFEAVKERQELAPYNARTVKVLAVYSPLEVIYTIKDDGPGFDTAALPDPTDLENLDKPSGRGLMLIRTFMDDVSFSSTGSEIRMVKRRASAKPATD
jgi:CheY-like chemotaxis protein/anti-sigma regulatory factor (Ser/Thr protein kinase)